jgi:hypothetical protein
MENALPHFSSLSQMAHPLAQAVLTLCRNESSTLAFAVASAQQLSPILPQIAGIAGGMVIAANKRFKN